MLSKERKTIKQTYTHITRRKYKMQYLKKQHNDKAFTILEFIAQNIIKISNLINSSIDSHIHIIICYGQFLLFLIVGLTQQ